MGIVVGHVGQRLIYNNLSFLSVRISVYLCIGFQGAGDDERRGCLSGSIYEYANGTLFQFLCLEGEFHLKH